MMEASRNVLVFVVSFFWELEPWRSAGAFKMSDGVKGWSLVSCHLLSWLFQVVFLVLEDTD
jgi:hypothetical protein